MSSILEEVLTPSDERSPFTPNCYPRHLPQRTRECEPLYQLDTPPFGQICFTSARPTLLCHGMADSVARLNESRHLKGLLEGMPGFPVRLMKFERKKHIRPCSDLFDTWPR
ncbi:hypothetical protein L208DRAFT_160190 [Tricholoma matsutake]|nr:hypothetical protein L208DRAFT_160190 [Tricholoma matsutake 945]